MGLPPGGVDTHRVHTEEGDKVTESRYRLVSPWGHTGTGHRWTKVHTYCRIEWERERE